jgi:hypothetical protein
MQEKPMELTDDVLDRVAVLWDAGMAAPGMEGECLVDTGRQLLLQAGVGPAKMIELMRLGLAVQRAKHGEPAGEIRRRTRERLSSLQLRRFEIPL